MRRMSMNKVFAVATSIALLALAGAKVVETGTKDVPKVIIEERCHLGYSYQIAWKGAGSVPETSKLRDQNGLHTKCSPDDVK
jgi:hypothetical protein